MMKTINNIFSWGISSGFFVALVWFLWGYVRPLLEAKKQHTKTVQQREALDMLLKFADTAVSSLTSRTDLAGHDKFKLATQQVRETMEAKGLSVTEGMIQDAVQAAYEKSPLTTPPTQSTVHVTADGITTTVGPVAKHIPAGDLKPASVNPADMPGAQKTPAKSKVPANTIAKKGIPTDNLKDVAVQTPQPEPQGDDANVNKD